MEIHFTGSQWNWAACHVELYELDMGGIGLCTRGSGGVLQIGCACVINSLCLDVSLSDSLAWMP